MKIYKILSLLLGCSLLILLAMPSVSLARYSDSEFSHEELYQMLAPVALYPDNLLSQVLMAATYPLEVVEADRWIKRHPLLKGDNLDDALQNQEWDASVKALCHIPAVLGVMSERLEETTLLGDAFLAQEQDVMDTIQDLRLRARREGNLNSDDKQQVTIEDDGTIVIEPADARTVYVPYYNTRYVYGPWWYSARSPWYWGPEEVVVGSNIYFWPEFYFGFSLGFGHWSYFDWSRRTITINIQHRPHFVRSDHRWASQPSSWRHEPNHRRGVVYRDRQTAERYGANPERLKRSERQATRERGRGGASGIAAGRDRTTDRSNLAANDGMNRENARPAARTGGSDVTPENPDHRGSARGEGGRRRSGGLAATPLATPRTTEATGAGEEDSRQDNEVQRQTTSRTRELTTDRQIVADPGSESGSERRGSSGREGRQLNTQERGGNSSRDGESRAERGGRR